MSTAHLHALHVRTPGPVDPAAVAGRFAAIVHPVLGPAAALWAETTPADAVSRRIDAELALPVPAGLRATLLCHDGQADLVVVTRPTTLDRTALHQLARALLDPEVPPPAWSPGSTPAPAVPTTAPRWGLGGPAGGGEVVPESGGDPATWLAALAVVLARYQDEETAFAAVLPAQGQAGAHVAVGAGAGQDTLGDLVRRFRAETAQDPRPVAAGLVFDAGCPPGATSYRPWLAPPFPLTIGVGETLRYVHDESVAPAIAAQFVRHLATVHRQVVASPDLPVADTGLFDAAERHRIAALGSPSRAVPRSADRIQDVFAQRVAERPDAIALSGEHARLTYRELAERSDRLADGLRRLGVRAGEQVGICLERSPDLVATMLAVLKAGACYVPMDPSYPVDRLAHTASDAGLKVVVTTVDRLSTAAVTPDQLASSTGAPPMPPENSTTAADPAYVIYTSGSTGRPKGVVVPHANVISLLAATRDDLRLVPEDVWTLFHSSAFDFSVWEIWGCLLTGGRLVVVPYWVSRSPEEFHDLLADEQVTVLNQTPSAFAALSDVDRLRARALRVRLVVFGGEPLDTRVLLPWFDRHPEAACRVVNMFGITETTVHVTAATVTRAAALAASRSVGTPLPGWSLHVLDPAGRQLPPGVAGEIHVGGAGVALGYLGRPGLTAERFVPDPFGGGRLYRSGDLGRLRPDGTLEHLGRIDNQVKVRGFRIELDEIRAVLLEDPAVLAAAVVLRPGDEASQAIHAYVVLDGSSGDEVRKRAARILPGHMVPAAVVAVPNLPLTVNGKIDTDRLPAPPKPAAPPRPADQADDLVRSLQEVWSAVLGLDVGPDDDFFDLGGNSLSAVRITAKARERHLPATPLRTLYQHPTIRGLADAVRDRHPE
ncbi:amino acid adenylation domain-containing protein [Lentzea sp. NPDC060358]|uniref:amino acid adenylation domain-containing protein n=1 Tax=Lentzea sp. NPDC060358 TaxID=3347103 RepID=UPI00366973D2